mgnify:CR=1 FL=1
MNPDQTDSSPPQTPDIIQVFTTFGMQALMACGRMRNPLTQKIDPDPDLAQFHIGVLEVLRDKTHGNLTDQETSVLKDILHQTRLAFLHLQHQRHQAHHEQPSTEQNPDEQ